MCTMCAVLPSASSCPFEVGMAPNTSCLLPAFQQSDRDEAADAAASPATQYQMQVGERFAGDLNTGGDKDWVKIDLEAGETYVFSVWGTNGLANATVDPALRLYDSDGKHITFNENIVSWNNNKFAQIEYTAKASDAYFLAVESNFNANGKPGGDPGDYILHATTNHFSVEDVAAQITEFGWGETAPLHFNVYTGGTITVDVTGLSSGGQKLATWALDAWSEVTGLTFKKVQSGNAQISFADDKPGAFGGPSSYDPATGIIAKSVVNIHESWLANYGDTYDSHTFQTYLHEIGHALGLMHTGNYNSSAMYGRDNHFVNDSTQISIMSYFGIGTARLGDFAVAVSPMIADVFAVWGLYGTPVAVHADDTVWGANSTVAGTFGKVMGYAFDKDPVDSNIFSKGEIAFTITDTGGHDTLDLSKVQKPQLIDLKAEGISNINGRDGNLVISKSTIIEDVIGGAGADTIFGNEADNRIDGGAGNDVIDGGRGVDTAVINDALSDVAAADLGNGALQIVSQGGTDVYKNIERFEFLDGVFSGFEVLNGGRFVSYGTIEDDVIIGTDHDNIIEALSGNDRVEGGAGDDRILGGDGHDGLLGQAGNDYLDGGAGDDRLPGADGNDEIYGRDGNDALGGGAGDDALYGGAGNDRIGAGPGEDIAFGGTGDDGIAGGAQSDRLYGEDGNDRMAGSFGSDLLYGGAGHDKMGGGYGNDEIHGGAGDDIVGAGFGDDWIYGDDGNDILNSGAGDDFIFGGGGNDRINSGLGNDTMTGGAGVDTFVFTQPGAWRDVVTDFELGIDMLALDRVAGPGASGKFSNLAISQQGLDTEIVWRDQKVVLENIDASALTADDFLFI